MNEFKVVNMICQKCGKFQPMMERCGACGFVSSRANPVCIRANEFSLPNSNFTRFKHESKPFSGPKQSLVVPMVSIGAVFISIAMFMAGNKFHTGWYDYGVIRYLDWLIVPCVGMIGVWCIAQALEWKINNR